MLKRKIMEETEGKENGVKQYKRLLEYELEQLKATQKRCRTVLKNEIKASLSVKCENSGEYYTAYNNGQRRYLAVGDPMINEIKTQYCARQVLKSVETDIRIIESLLYDWKEYDPYLLKKTFPRAYLNQPAEGLKRLGFIDPEEWKNQPYRRNLKYPEQLIHKTKSGLMVRSRGEVFIANLYDELMVPYHYEEIVVLPDGTEVSPDFRILPGLQFKLHEHFGLMGNPEYVESFLWKEKAYRNAGLVPYRDILFTFDGVAGEFDAQYLDQSIRQFIGR